MMGGRGTKRLTGLTCAHCRRPQNGASTFQREPLCHPDFGLDCYALVTVHRHPMPCGCATTSAHPDMDVCDRCEYRRFEHQVDVERTRTDFLGFPVPCFPFQPRPLRAESVVPGGYPPIVICTPPPTPT